MSDGKFSERKQREIEELAQGWGKMLAREACPNGPGLTMDLFSMEELANRAARALVRGAVETLTEDQVEQLGPEHACPQCGKSCHLERRSRLVQVRGGEANLEEPVAHCSTCRRDFFPSASRAEAGRASV